jgi:hypothetical protein
MNPGLCEDQTPTRTFLQASGVGGADSQGTLNSPGKKVDLFFLCVGVGGCAWVWGWGEGCGVVARMSVYQYRGGTGRSIMGRVEGGAAVCAHHLVRV